MVVRAEFELQLVNLLPHDLRQALEGAVIKNAEWATPLKMTVDLFRPSEVPVNALRAIALYDAGRHTLDQIGQELGITLRNAHRAKELGKAMREAGLTDPYIRLTEPPANVAHWHIDPRYFQKDNDGQNAA